MGPSPSRPPAGLKLALPSDLTQVRRVARAVVDFLKNHGCAESDIVACELALVEASNNAIQHASPTHRSVPVQIEAAVDAQQISLLVIDHTAGFEWPSAPSFPGPDAAHGRGVPLITSLMDEVEYSRSQSGNTLRLCKRRARA